MKNRIFFLSVVLLALVFGFVLNANAEVIYLKDGTVIRGKIIESTEDYVRVLVGKEGAQAETVIYRDKILRIELDTPSTTPSATKSEVKIEDKAEAYAKAALTALAAGDNDGYLDNIVLMMTEVQSQEEFKKYYRMIEDPAKKGIPEILEAQMKIPCGKVIHPKPFFRLCPVCKGEKVLERTVDGKKVKTKCATCDGKGVVECETCIKKLKKARDWRKKVRYTPAEMEKIAWINFYLNGIKETTASPIINKILGKAKTYELERTEEVIKYEVTFKEETVPEFEKRMAASGVNVTKSTTATNLYVIKINP